jgi:hypothetical protein
MKDYVDSFYDHQTAPKSLSLGAKDGVGSTRQASFKFIFPYKGKEKAYLKHINDGALRKDGMPKKTSQLCHGRSTYLFFTSLGDGHP